MSITTETELSLQAPYQSFGFVFQNHFTRGQEAHLTDNGCFLLVSLQTKITKFLCKHKSENYKLGEESQYHKKLWVGRDPKAQLVPPPAMGTDIFN